MAVTMDYYTLLGISRNASVTDVRTAYKQKIKIWKKLAATSSEDSIKDEAIQRLTLLGEALDTLVNEQRRAVYNKQLRSTSTEIPSTAIPTNLSTSNLIEQAEDYLSTGNYHAAAVVAREATMHMGNSAESWFVLSRATAGLQQLDKAVYEAQRAIDIAPNNSMYYFNLGTIYEELGSWDKALRAYEQASQLEPNNPLSQLAIGGVLLQTDHLSEAISVIEPVYSRIPDNETACYYYAQALIAKAEAVPEDRSSEGYAVTRAAEIQEMQNYLNRAANIKNLDQETKRIIHDTEAYLRDMETYTFHIPLGPRTALSEMLGADLGCFPSLVMILIMIAFALLPLLLVLWSFSVFAGGAILNGLALLLFGVGLGYVWYRAMWVPKWKVNARNRDHRVRYLG